MTEQIQHISLIALARAREQQQRRRQVHAVRLWASDNRELLTIAAGVVAACACVVWLAYAMHGR